MIGNSHCTCEKNQFLCMNKRCIPESWACNGVDNCGDGSDELRTQCKGIKKFVIVRIVAHWYIYIYILFVHIHILVRHYVTICVIDPRGVSLNGLVDPCSNEAAMVIAKPSNRVIFSPGYPDPYPGNANCTWHIKAYPGYTIQLSFLEFDTEYE